MLFFSVPAVSAEFAAVDADGFLQALKGLEFEGGEVEAVADRLAHGASALCGPVRIFLQMLEAFVALQFHDDLAHFKEYAQQAEHARSDAVTAANAAGGYSSQARQAVNQAQSAMNAAQRAASSASESAAAAQAAVVNAADNGSVDASGLISFRHGTTELFTVQLPLYDGSVTYGS